MLRRRQQVDILETAISSEGLLYEYVKLGII